MNLRYKNIEEIKNGIGAIYARQYDSTDLNLILTRAEYSLLVPNDATSIELFVFDSNLQFVAGDHDISRYTDIYTSNNDIYFDINVVLTALNINQGDFKLFINYHKNIVGDYDTVPLYIDQISPDRTELKININPSIVSSIARTYSGRTELADALLKQISDLFYNNTDTRGFSGTNYTNPIFHSNVFFDEYAINFGNNDLYKIINAKIDLDPVQISDINTKYQVSIYVKLFQPLSTRFNENDSLWIVRELIDTYTDNILITSNAVVALGNKLRGPNFDLEMNQNSGIETSLKSWNDLLGSNLSTNQRIIDTTLSSSFGGIDLNIDYTSFDNFIFYSSAEERIRNFYYKLQLVEYYNTQIVSLNNASGSLTSSKANTVLLNTNRKANVISGFDTFERWLYNEQTSSLFTHAVSGSVLGALPYHLKPWPKYLSGSGENVIHYTTSSLGTAWFNGYVASASLYDQLNSNRLANSIPLSIREDDENSQYVLFVDMIAHHFDILWSYVHNLNNKLSRDEHPRLGIPSELLQSVAKSFGFDLYAGYKMKDLWTYKLGTSISGSFQTTGSLASKASENATTEIWRRIVNNIPYLLRTKGTKRAISAVMNTYGIPQTLISVKEFGGPAVTGEDAALIDDRFNYALDFDDAAPYIVTRRNYVFTTPSGNYSEPPGTIAVRIKPAYAHTGAILTFQSGSLDREAYWSLSMEPTGSFSGSANYGRLKFSMVTGSALTDVSSSLSGYFPLYDGDWWNIMITPDTPVTSSSVPYTTVITTKIQKASDYIAGKVIHSSSIPFNLSVQSGAINRNWINWCPADITFSGSIYIGTNRGTTGVPGAGAYSGSMQAYKEYSERINQSTFDYHTLNPAAYRGNNPTSSYYTLTKYYPFGVDGLRFIHVSGSIISSSSPQYTRINFGSGSVVKNYDYAIAYDFRTVTYNYIDNEERFYTYGPESFGSSVRSQKIRFDSSILKGNLSPDTNVARSIRTNTSADTNKVVVAFSPQDQINNDIYNHIGAVDLDSYFGLPSYQYEYEYTKLRKFSEEYWKKYPNKSNINEYIRVFSLFDLSFFEMIKQMFPARVNLVSGILIEPSILEKSKAVAYILPEHVNNTYTSSIDSSISTYVSGTYLSQTSSIVLYDPYAPSLYSYTGVTFSGSGFITSSTHPLLASPTGSYISGYRSSSVFSRIQYHYSSSAPWATTPFLIGYDIALSSSLHKYYSKSLHSTDYRDEEFTGMTRMFYEGSQLVGPGINIPTTNTPDGTPVVEYRIVSDNIFIAGSDTATTGRLVVES